jgi:hypothetical protein
VISPVVARFASLATFAGMPGTSALQRHPTLTAAPAPIDPQ